MKFPCSVKGVFDARSAPTRGPWIEIHWKDGRFRLTMSAPTRGPWIEISGRTSEARSGFVGPHTGAVD